MSQEQKARDRLFTASRLPGDFVFDEKVAAVFDDMINRSVPGYSTILAMLGVMAQRYCQAGSIVYDLGASLGGATHAVARGASHQDYRIVAVDNSAAMINKLEDRLRAEPLGPEVDCRCENIQETDIGNASMVVLNFTLQFIPVSQRRELIERIYRGMNDGAVLVVSEKIELPNPILNALMIDLYHEFKESMGYSKLEISQKRTALENVLVPETLATHRQRLLQTGFNALDVWFQCFNFASMVAFK